MSMMKKFLNFSGMINAGLVLIVLLGWMCCQTTAYQAMGHVLTTIGLYGLSGSVTNVLAIIMIFDKIPFIIGSGLIEANFEDFKKKLKNTLMLYLFAKAPELSQNHFNYQDIAKKVHPNLLKTSFGVMFQWLSIDQVAALLKEIKLEDIMIQSIGPKEWDAYLTTQIHQLSVQQIKELVFQILEDHLQWLVFWGALLGIMIGCIDLLLR